MMALKGWKLAGAVVGALMALGIVGFVFDRLFLAPGRAKQAAIQFKADVGGAEAQAAAAKDAVATGERIERVRETIERTTRENTIRIMAAPGAGDPVPAAVAVELDRALGLRNAYQGHGASQRVPDPAAGVGADGNTGR
ncbi:hypothetical protein [Sandarakinorhabdus sp.]|uniref:hypothetical protein n=1 Tax=Sandarakinorhabdus sp. TaxID=1916663 RepID=UPI00286DBB11|nr:hypothetical protein [Sandarakinorhabdus sp.]